MENSDKKALAFGLGAVAVGAGIAVLVSQKAKASPSPTTATLLVTVTDSVTGQPVSGAQVSIAGMALNTNSVGQCIFTGIPVGQYEITVTMAGYL
jgi:methylmalonyl-CoA mutase N-terminal domain/subunit